MRRSTVMAPATSEPTSCAICPGGCVPLPRHSGRVISISASQAADHIMQLLRGNYDSGLYGRNAKHNTPSDFKANPANRDKLWQMSETMLQQALDKPSV